MRNLFSAIVLAVLWQAALAETTDTTVCYSWNDSTGMWEFDHRTIAAYDENKNITYDIDENWNAATWVNGSQRRYWTYDANGNLVDFYSQQWDGANWVNLFRIINTYDGNDNLITQIRQDGDGSGGWNNSTRYTYTYNAFGTSSRLTEEWDSNGWVYDEFDGYGYDTNGNLDTSVHSLWIDTNWVNNRRYVKAYDNFGDQISYLIEKWNGLAWEYLSFTSYGYDVNGNRSTEKYQTWDGNQWVNGNQDLYTYDSNNNLTLSLSQQWNGTAWENSNQTHTTYNNEGKALIELNESWNGTAWVNSSQQLSTYDAQGNLISQTYQSWNGTQWVNINKCEYRRTLTAVQNIPFSNRLTLYPNPSDRKVSINLDGNNGMIAVTVADAVGKLVSQNFWNSATTMDIDLKGANGLYFIHLRSENGERTTLKIIKQ